MTGGRGGRGGRLQCAVWMTLDVLGVQDLRCGSFLLALAGRGAVHLAKAHQSHYGLGTV